MLDFQIQDIERVCRLGNVSRIHAIELLRRYGGKPDRVMTEHFGRARLYIEPLSVRDPAEARREALRQAMKRMTARRLIMSNREGCVVFNVPLWPAVAVGAMTAPFSAAAALGAVAAGCRFSAQMDEDDCPGMA